MTLIKKTGNMLPEWFEDFFQDANLMPRTKTVTIPAVNIYEKEDRFEIDMAIPGMDKKDIKIKLDNDTLTISSVVETGISKDVVKYTKQEFCYNEFSRSFILPETADAEKITASSENGLLKVVILKKDESIIKPEREIEIM